MYVKLDGSGFSSMYGDIVETGIEEFDVYSWFPHDEATANAVINNGGNWFEDTDHIWTNHITMYDTIWTQGLAMTLNNQSFWVGSAQLWIEGEINGATNFGCADTIYIVGDITYTNTIPGDPPDDPDNPNLTDYFGLVSEKRIYIKYKHRDPFNNMEIRDDNCSDVMLYGAYAAIGIGDTLIYGDLACHYDGIFSFEYQHPHGSTPDFTAMSPYTFQDTTYTFIDFHKFIYPITPNIPPNIQGFTLHGNSPQINGTCGFPYEAPDYLNSYPNNNFADYAVPYGTDYPWYNPVWPESSNDIVSERGMITIFGSIAQRRRGYVHRSGGDPYNHPGDNQWEMDIYHYDGTHGSSGYSKDYHYDSRFLDITPPDYPVSNPNGVEPKIVITVSEDAGVTFIQQQEWQLTDMMTQRLPIASQDNIVAVAYQKQYVNFIYLHYSIDNGNTFALYVIVDSPAQSLQDLQIYDDEIYIFAKGSTNEYVYKFDPYNYYSTTLFEFDSINHLSDFAIGNEGGKVYTSIEEPITYPGSFKFQYTSDDPYVLGEEYIWQTPFNVENPLRSVLAINFNEQDSVFVSFLNAVSSNHDYGDLYLTKGSLPELVETEENEIVKPVYSLDIYPNPFNPSTTIKFSTENTEENIELIIYNIKGQKVRTLLPNLCHGEFIEPRGINNQYSIIWNGTDDSGKMVGSGIYFCRLKVNSKSKAVKKMVLVK